MQRRTALAAAAAITMSVTSGVVAIGANTGLFGLSGGTTPTKRPAVVLTESSVTTGATGTPVAPVASVAPAQTYEVAASEHEGDDGHEREHESDDGHEREHESDDGHEREHKGDDGHEREHEHESSASHDDD